VQEMKDKSTQTNPTGNIVMKRSRKLWFIVGAVSVAFAVAILFNLTNKGQADDTALAVAPVAVEVTRVGTSPISNEISAVGTIAAWKDVDVSSEASGRVTRVMVNVGDFVKANQLLALVDDELKSIGVDRAKAQLIAAETSYKKSQRDFQRAEQLRSNDDISDAEFEAYRLSYRSAEAAFRSAEVDLRFAQRELEDTRIKSPIAGYVASKGVEIGEMVSRGKVVANIVDMSSIKVKLSIPEEEIGNVKVNQEATLRIDTAPQKVFDGTVFSVSSKTETPTGHTYAVEVTVKPGTENILKVGMFGRVVIKVAEVPDAVAVSKEALVSEEGNTATVYVADGDIARLRSVELGVRSNDMLQVVDGLNVGDLVISFGQKKLKDGTVVRYKI